VALTVSAGAPYSDALDVRVSGAGATISLGRSATDALYVSGGTPAGSPAKN